MGFFKDTRPYTAISADIDALTVGGDDDDPARLLDVIELIQGNRVGGCAEAGRALRKKIKYGSPGEQLKTLNLISVLVDNGGKSLFPMVTETGLGDQLVQLARVPKDSRQTKKAQQLLLSWSSRGNRLSGYFTQAGLKEAKRGRRRGDGSQSFSQSGDDSNAPSLPRRPVGNTNNNSTVREPSRSPSPINLRGASLTTTIATAHSVATRLLNSLILTNQNPSKSRESRGYCRQAKQIRHNLIQLISDEDPEVQAYLAQLIQANEELINSIRAYDRVLSGDKLDADDGVEPLPEIRPLRTAPSPQASTRSIHSPSRDSVSISNSDEEIEASAGEEENNPFDDANEDTYGPKHTPIW